MTTRLFACVGLALAAMQAAPSPALAQGPATQQLSYEQPLAPAGVRAVQDRLRQMGAFTGTVDGVWGEASGAALREFQQGHGLQPTGQLNQATAAVLSLVPADLLRAAPDQPQEGRQLQERRLTPAETRNLQARLGQLGYYRGPVDGIWGPGMQSALQRFQQSSGLQVSGRLNRQSVTAMGLNPDDLAQAAR
jgi:peptidoglycan hydrolase-like protein with peptidoglycan-binding domain